MNKGDKTVRVTVKCDCGGFLEFKVPFSFVKLAFERYDDYRKILSQLIPNGSLDNILHQDLCDTCYEDRYKLFIEELEEDENGTG